MSNSDNEKFQKILDEANFTPPAELAQGATVLFMGLSSKKISWLELRTGDKNTSFRYDFNKENNNYERIWGNSIKIGAVFNHPDELSPQEMKEFIANVYESDGGKFAAVSIYKSDPDRDNVEDSFKNYTVLGMDGEYQSKTFLNALNGENQNKALKIENLRGIEKDFASVYEKGSMTDPAKGYAAADIEKPPRSR